MNRNMKNRYRVFRRGWGTYYCDICAAKGRKSVFGSIVDVFDSPLDLVPGAIERKARHPKRYEDPVDVGEMT